MHCKRDPESALPETSDPYIFWVCRKNVKYFGIGIKHIYSFKPNKTLETQLNVHLFQNGKELTSSSIFQCIFEIFENVFADQSGSELQLDCENSQTVLH